MVIGRLFGAVISNDMDCLIVSQCQLQGGENSPSSLTKHVSAFVLASTLFSYVRLDAKISQSQVFHTERGRVNAPDDTESPAIVNVVAELPELRTEGRQGKVGSIYKVAVLTKG